ncbi:MAG: hypothetical protein V4613_13270 [Bacteroidota bacterium]
MKFIYFLLFIAFSCDNPTSKKNISIKPLEDIPTQNSLLIEIDSTHIWMINTCDDFKNIGKTDSLKIRDTIIDYEDDFWNGKLINIKKNEFILVENRGLNSNQISKISTNSSSILIKPNIYIGDSLGAINKSDLEVFYEAGEIFFFIRSQNIYIRCNNPLKVKFSIFEKIFFDDPEKIFETINFDAIIIEASILSYCKY